MSDAHAVARDQLRAFIERIERLEEEKKSIADDIKDVYGEAKGTGFDTKILRKVIAIRKQDRDERAEQEAILDSYLIALGMIDQPGFFDDEPRQSAPVERQRAMALRSDGGLSIFTHEDIRTAPVVAEENTRPATLAVSGGEPSIPSSDAGGEKMDGGQSATPGRLDDTSGHICAKSERATNINSEMDRATESSFETGSEAAEKGRKATATVAAPADLNHAGAGESPATPCEYCDDAGDVHRIDGEWLGYSHCEYGQRLKAAPATPSDDGAIAAVNGKAGLANADGVEPPSSGQVETPSNDDADHAVGANAGGCHVESIASRERDGTPTSNTGEGAACALPAKPKFVLRPYCRNPGETCGGSGTTHCHSCLKAREEVAA